ncbi:MAG: phosphatase PAP2 family protein [Mycoplasmataceae bacterium]|nr:phosphatase PAP2 family protein [Mycoplasmataceae bacterium]
MEFFKKSTLTHIRETIFYCLIPTLSLESLRCLAWVLINLLNNVQVKHWNWWQIIPIIPSDYTIIPSGSLDLIYGLSEASVVIFSLLIYYFFGKKIFLFYLFNTALIWIFVYSFYIVVPCFDYLKNLPQWNGKPDDSLLNYVNFCAFPSSHCLIAYSLAFPMLASFFIEKKINLSRSIICIIAVTFAILTQISTVLTRQHYIMDGFASLGVGLIFTVVNYFIYQKHYIKNEKLLPSQIIVDRFYVYAQKNKRRELMIIIVFAVIFVSLNYLFFPVLYHFV